MSFYLGMLRWTLHNRVDRNPSICVPLVRVLIKELEKVCFFKLKYVSGLCRTRFYHQSKVAVVQFPLWMLIWRFLSFLYDLFQAERIDSKIRIIPLLHTLAYAVLQVRFLWTLLFVILLFPVSDVEYICKQVPCRFVIVGTSSLLLNWKSPVIGLFFSHVCCMLLIGFSALFQSVFIPEDLYRRIYISLKSLVTLPVPYCAIALNYARQMKLEQIAPGNRVRLKAFLVLIFMCCGFDQN